MVDRNTFNTTVIFADVSGSSRLYKRLGDREANLRITRQLGEMAAIVERCQGTVIKTIGDEIMAHVVDPASACEAAVAIQQSSQHALPVRIGMAWGEVIERDADLFGETVNNAAAVVQIARGGQIITTGEFRAQLPGDDATRIALFDRVRLKGGQDETGIYRVEWQTEESTRGAEHTVMSTDSGQKQEKLTLTFNSEDGSEQTLVILPEDSPFRIGRGEEYCDLAISASFVSREHCHIDYEHNNFMLKDHSTNGTHVTTAYGQTIVIRRGEFPLVGSGTFAVGRESGDGGVHVISFKG